MTLPLDGFSLPPGQPSTLEAERTALRLKVVRDTLKNLDTGRFLAGHEGFMCPTAPDAWDIYLAKNPGADLSVTVAQFFTPKAPCTVCVIGALFFSAVMPGSYTVERFESDESAEFYHSSLSTLFDPHQIELIECAYEGARLDYHGRLSAEDEVACEAFYDRTARATDSMSEDACLRAILKNILRNEGTFVPTDARAS